MRFTMIWEIDNSVFGWRFLKLDLHRYPNYAYFQWCHSQCHFCVWLSWYYIIFALGYSLSHFGVDSEAESTLSVVCETFTEHTLAKFVITRGAHYIVIQDNYNRYYGPCGINILHVHTTLNFELNVWVFSQSVTHDW